MIKNKTQIHWSTPKSGGGSAFGLPGMDGFLQKALIAGGVSTDISKVKEIVIPTKDDGMKINFYPIYEFKDASFIGAFYNATSIVGDIRSIVKLDSSAFYGNKKLKTITIPPLVESKVSFCRCSSLEKVVFLGSKFKLDNSAFSFTNSLKTIILHRDDPPADFRKGDMPTTCKIYVPDEAVDAYKAATGWVDVASQIYPLSSYTE